jgi:hypothetical protein
MLNSPNNPPTSRCIIMDIVNLLMPLKLNRLCLKEDFDIIMALEGLVA